jgi:hypothetical protein
VIHNARNKVRNEEGCGAINPCCSGVACCWSDTEAQTHAKIPKDWLALSPSRFNQRLENLLELQKD